MTSDVDVGAAGGVDAAPVVEGRGSWIAES